MKKLLLTMLSLVFALLVPQYAAAWNATGHKLVARVAWENMNDTVRGKLISILQGAPQDACLLDMFPNDQRPLAERQREFFVKVSTWADVVRPNERQGVLQTCGLVRSFIVETGTSSTSSGKARRERQT